METYDDVDVLAKNSAMLETKYRDIAATNQFPRENNYRTKGNMLTP